MPICNSERARTMLARGRYTCILCDKDRILTSSKSGILPILERMEEGIQGMSVADKIVGRAAALLLVAGHASDVYGEVMSRGALDILKEYRIPASYGTLTERINNREGTDQCPMEKAVAQVTDPNEAAPVLRKALEELSRQ